MDEQVFGAPAGQLNDLAAQGLKNDYNNLPNTDIEAGMVSDRVLPRQVGTGVTRGTWRINNTDGSYITIGEIPDSSGEFGVAYFDVDGNLISKDEGATRTLYDAVGTQVSEDGLLSTGEYGTRYSDGTVTTTITAAGIKQNDGTNDRLFLGNEA